MKIRGFRCLAILLAVLSGPACCLSATQVDDDDLRLEELVISTARTPRLLRDEPLRVEAVPAEEIEENSTVSPGTLTSLLEELPGVQFQSSAPGLGGTGLRLRGLPSRYTQVRNDGLPLMAVAPESFGLLQSPPLDLSRVEVIKGASSSLYGTGSIGGVLNLVSRQPGAESAALLSANSRPGQDLVAYLADEKPAALTGSVLIGLHRQDARDADHDAWLESPAFRRAVLRPRGWFEVDGTQLFVTAGLIRESRQGGTVPGAAMPAYGLALDTQREDFGLRANGDLSSNLQWHVTGSFASASLQQAAGLLRSRSKDVARGAEFWISTLQQGHDWLLGAAWQSQSIGVSQRPELGLRSAAPALFAQDEWRASEAVRVSASLRVDDYGDLGRPVSDRVAILWRPLKNDSWALRASTGTGFAVPSLWVDEIEYTGPGVLAGLAHSLRREQGATTALDLRWTGGDLELDAGVFQSRVKDRLGLAGSGSQLLLINEPGALKVPGVELVTRYVDGPWHVMGNWTYLDPREDDGTGVTRPMDRVPRQSAELAVLYERAGRGRIGIELGYTGRQALRDDPARTQSDGYLQLSFLAAIRLRKFSVFFNAENLTDVRQSNYGGFWRPVPGIGGMPVRDAWAPLEGRTVNLGVSMEL